MYERLYKPVLSKGTRTNTHTHTHTQKERQSQRFKKLTHTVEGKLSPKSAVQAVRLETPDKC